MQVLFLSVEFKKLTISDVYIQSMVVKYNFYFRKISQVSFYYPPRPKGGKMLLAAPEA